MPDGPWQSVSASAVRRHKLFSWLMDALNQGRGEMRFGRNRLGIRAAHTRCECQVPARRCQAAGRGAQIILIKKAPTESGLQVRSHLPEGKPARKARAGRAKLKLHGFAGPVIRSFGRSTNRPGGRVSPLTDGVRLFRPLLRPGLRSAMFPL
jgi:hypothetical protein